MIYKLLNYIFGWDYIAWQNSADQGIARVRVDHCGTVFYWRYRNTKVVDRICDGDGVLWLTCRPEKYLNGENHG